MTNEITDVNFYSLDNICNSFFLWHVGTSVIQVTATDGDDPTYGNSARVVYSILQGQPYFSVDPKTGRHKQCVNVYLFVCLFICFTECTDVH